MKYSRTLKAIIDAERENLLLWTPIIFSIGILTYFSLSFEPELSYVLLPLLVSMLALFILHKNKIVHRINIIIILVLLGFCAAKYRVYTVESPIFPYTQKFTFVKGVIEAIIPQEFGSKVIIKDLKLWRIDREKTPKKIRLNFRTKLNDAQVGDYIKVKAVLSSPPKPIIPGGYDFARKAYFQQIGATGFSVSEAIILKKADHGGSIIGYIERIRMYILSGILNTLGKKEGGVVTALMIGEYASMDKLALNDMRVSGLAHLLSVSGMHLSLVAAIFFFGTRFLLNLIFAPTLRMDVKKIAAVTAIIGSFLYLLLTGVHIAATRAFIMTFVFLFAILVDRSPTPMRSIAFAAMAILLCCPEEIVYPSFQMSFSAVIALIAVFQLFSKYSINFLKKGFFIRLLFYFISLCLSSLIAGLATAPFAAYHFNQFSNYGVLANLIAVPITSFMLMPLVVLTFLLFPFGIYQPVLKLISYGVGIIIDVAHYVANLPKSYFVVPHMPEVSILLITFGFLWFCIFTTRIRYIGAGIILCALPVIYLTKAPVAIIDGDSGKFVIMDNQRNQRNVVFSTGRTSRFKKNVWLNYLGKKDYIPMRKYKAKHNFTCEDKICSLDVEGRTILIDSNQKYNALSATVDLLVTPYIQDTNERGQSINKADLEESGTHLIFVDKRGLKLQTVKNLRGERPWTKGYQNR
jgi:competence protein ComEC